MARPRTYNESPRTQTITVRVTPAEHARLSAEAAQIGVSLAGLAERYLSKGSIRIEASQAPAPLHPALIAELKRIGADLNQIAYAVKEQLPPHAGQVTEALRDLVQLILKDELLSQRAHALRTRTTANDTAPPSPRDQFQRVVHLRPARSEGENE